MLYERLISICAQKGISITNLCVQATGSKGNLTTWKNGNMRLDHLIKCSEILNLSTDYILGINEKAAPISVDQDGIKKTLNLMTEEEVDELILFSEYLLYKRKSRPMTDGQE